MTMDSLPRTPENVEKQENPNPTRNNQIVNMSDPGEVRSTFPLSDRHSQDPIDSSGKLSFPDLYGGMHSDHHEMGEHRHCGGKHRDDSENQESKTGQGAVNPSSDSTSGATSSTGAGTAGDSSTTSGATSAGDSATATSGDSSTATSGDSSTATVAASIAALEQQIASQISQIGQEFQQIATDLAQLNGGSTSTGSGSDSNGSPTTGSGSDSTGSTTTGTTGDSTGSSTTGNGSTTNASLANLEQADPSVAATLNAASKTMSASGFSDLQNYLAINNPNNTNLDASLMSSAVTQGILDQTDTTALQQAEISNMQPAQIMTFAEQSDPALFKTLSDVASSQISTQGWGQVENYLASNYTGDSSMDSTLMNNVVDKSGLSAADQSAVTGVLKTDMSAALATDPFAAGLQTSDSSLYKTLTDASQSLSQNGYQNLESYVENNYTGQASSDASIMKNSLSQAGLDSGDVTALNKVLQSDMPSAVPGTTDTNGSGSGSGNDNTSTTGSSGSGNDNTSATGSSGSGNDNTSTGSTGNGNPTSTTTFETGGGTLLEPPQTSSGLVTPEGSLSGDNTAYQGTINGTTAGANNVKADSLTTGQGNGPDALKLSTVSNITTIDSATGAGFEQKYGYFEADIKLSQGADGKVTPNLWPGWFLESADHTMNPTGAVSSEIDIMEAQTSNSDGHGDTAYNAGVHLNSSTYGNGSVPDKDQGPYTTDLPSISSGYNTYGVNWQPNDKNIEFYFDGKEVGYNPVYDTTDSSPMAMVLDVINGGWNTTDPSASGGSMDVAWVRAYQNENLVNSANDPHGTVGSTITDTNPDDSPPALTNASDGGGNTPVTWVNTFNSDFTQASDYTDNGSSKNPNILTSGNMSTVGSGADNTPWYEGQWMVDQATSDEGVSAGMSTTPGANG